MGEADFDPRSRFHSRLDQSRQTQNQTYVLASALYCWAVLAAAAAAEAAVCEIKT